MIISSVQGQASEAIAAATDPVAGSILSIGVIRRLNQGETWASIFPDLCIDFYSGVPPLYPGLPADSVWLGRSHIASCVIDVDGNISVHNIIWRGIKEGIVGWYRVWCPSSKVPDTGGVSITAVRVDGVVEVHPQQVSENSTHCISHLLIKVN